MQCVFNHVLCYIYFIEIKTVNNLLGIDFEFPLFILMVTNYIAEQYAWSEVSS